MFAHVPTFGLSLTSIFVWFSITGSSICFSSGLNSHSYLFSIWKLMFTWLRTRLFSFERGFGHSRVMRVKSIINDLTHCFKKIPPPHQTIPQRNNPLPLPRNPRSGNTKNSNKPQLAPHLRLQLLP